jgi:hypothetical protein
MEDERINFIVENVVLLLKANPRDVSSVAAGSRDVKDFLQDPR